jgi:hypothetical protein
MLGQQLDEPGEKCEESGCLAAVLDPGLGTCLAHTPSPQRQEWLKQLAEEPPK